MATRLPAEVVASLQGAPLTYAEVGATSVALPPGYHGFSSPRVESGAVVEMRLGPPRLGVRIPCRVVQVVDEPHRGGFAYGTLPGHPETGEERFEVRRRPDGGAAFTVTAFSRPASLLARAGGPLSRWMQGRMTERYLRVADRPDDSVDPPLGLTRLTSARP